MKRKKAGSPIESALNGLRARDMTPKQRKDKAILIRVTEAEREEIQDTAARLGLTVSAYLLQLHGHAKGSL